MRKLSLLLAVLLFAACTYPTYSLAPEPEVKADEPAPEPEPEPIPEPEPEPVIIEAPYYLYIVDSLGGIVIFNDCSTWQVNGWASIDAYYEVKHRIYSDDCATGTWGEYRPWHLVAWQLYEEPAR